MAVLLSFLASLEKPGHVDGLVVKLVGLSNLHGVQLGKDVVDNQIVRLHEAIVLHKHQVIALLDVVAVLHPGCQAHVQGRGQNVEHTLIIDAGTS